MHDELPSGDLSQLLGEIKAEGAYTDDGEEPDDDIPILTERDQNHHLIVFAGQECEPFRRLHILMIDLERRIDRPHDLWK